ncbi:hypothetical protein NQ314_002363 [Rhamnusium bicolor]|uniref:Uncharacterized protein n=1 Tax=Rhamnusium bicolor TaxID=1586634 RepID=A0AAV8ZPS3_9CUCU|nr:hypothetical protein NQ314_002363 [Rhamnusium bicolor]
MEYLVAAEKRISKVEECDCRKSCQINGTVHADGATWQSGCQLCACVVSNHLNVFITVEHLYCHVTLTSSYYIS